MYQQLTEAEKARVAFMRFGLGPKPGWNAEARLGTGPDAARKALLAEIAAGPVQISESEVKVPSTASNGAELSFTFAQTCKFAMNITFMPKAVATNNTAKPASTAGDHNYVRPTPWDFQIAERALRLVKYRQPEVGFVERLVLFWVNHFSIYGAKHGLVAGTAGHLEREVIRRHVLGNFSDMLKGVLTHPAMIVYLDNHTSVGPNSTLGRKWRATYNENLAREILELHTVGVYGGYTQNDVISLSKIITGWTVYPKDHALAGQFFFNPDTHEPGSQTVMGNTFAQQGVNQGLAALADLAARESTAEHIATKLIRHFVSDTPDATMVATLKKTFINSKGDLGEVAKALINMDTAWIKPGKGVRRPYEWLASIVRGMNLDDEKTTAWEASFNIAAMNMNNQIWRRMTPDGYPDDNYVWETEDAIRVRKDAAGVFLGDGTIWKEPRWETIDPVDYAKSLLPGILSITAATEIAKLNANPLQAMNLLFVTPEYLRR